MCQVKGQKHQGQQFHPDAHSQGQGRQVPASLAKPVKAGSQEKDHQGLEVQVAR
jgi:hypothetical protein